MVEQRLEQLLAEPAAEQLVEETGEAGARGGAHGVPGGGDAFRPRDGVEIGHGVPPLRGRPMRPDTSQRGSERDRLRRSGRTWGRGWPGGRLWTRNGPAGPISHQLGDQAGHDRHEPMKQERGEETEAEGDGGPDADPAGGVLGVRVGPGGQLGAEPVQGAGDGLTGAGGPGQGPAERRQPPGPSPALSTPPRGRHPSANVAAGVASESAAGPGTARRRPG